MAGEGLEGEEGIRSSADESVHHAGRMGTLGTNSEMSRMSVDAGSNRKARTHRE